MPQTQDALHLSQKDDVVRMPMFVIDVTAGVLSKTSYTVICLIFACLLVYWPVFTHDFQFKWDDHWVVMNDYTEGGFNSENLGYIFTEFFHGQYAPINELFYLSLFSLFNYNSFWFHTASLLVHISNVLLVYFLIRKILTSSNKFASVSIFRISFLTALLMAIHPFMVEAVSWLSASKCIICAFFYLLSLHSYVSYLRNKKIWSFIFAVVFFILAFGGKEQAVTLPVCLLLLDKVLDRDLSSSKIWFEKLPFFCLSLSFGIITVYSQAFNNEGILSSQVHYPFYQNAVFATYTVSEYLIKCILPIHLSYLYPFPSLPGSPLPGYLWIYPFVLVLVSIAFWKFWKQTWILFGIGFFLIQVSLVSNIIPMSRYSIIADRYIYLGAVGIFFLMAYLYDRLIQNKPNLRMMMMPIVIIYFMSLGIYAHQRCKVWHNSDTLKQELKITIKSRSDYNDWLKKNNEPID